MQNDLDTFQPIFQVSEFNELLNQHLSLLGDITIEGELTRIDIKNNQLIFCSIKDKNSSLDVFSMAHLLRNFRQFEVEMLVRVTGTAGVYKGTTKFRFFANTMTAQGEGALQIAYEKLKKQLEGEGLFAPQRKRPLPNWPSKIALITAKNSSAYYDLVKIMTNRMSGLNLKLLPVNVQGKLAIPTIMKAINFCNLHENEFDVIIMARGGGSLEDLQAFNSEEIARAVFSSKVPIVSAIGHEDNWSLTDFVADLRASTPSNAAELVVRDRLEVIDEIDNLIQLIKQRLNFKLHRQKSILSESVFRIKSRSAIFNSEIDKIIIKIQNLVSQRIKLTRHELQATSRLLDSLDIKHILARGFSITKNNQGQIIKIASDVQLNEIITTEVASGIIISKRTSI